jgi:hypothetical protein
VPIVTDPPPPGNPQVWTHWPGFTTVEDPLPGGITVVCACASGAIVRVRIVQIFFIMLLLDWFVWVAENLANRHIFKSSFDFIRTLNTLFFR